MITCTSALTLSSYIHTPVHTISTHTSLPTRPTPSSSMFEGAIALNGDLRAWDLSHVWDMRYVSDAGGPHTTTYRCRHSKPNT